MKNMLAENGFRERSETYLVGGVRISSIIAPDLLGQRENQDR